MPNTATLPRQSDTRFTLRAPLRLLAAAGAATALFMAGCAT